VAQELCLKTALSDSQRLVVGPRALARVNKLRQRHICAKEAGGQLFGSVTDAVVSVELAVGPHKGDDRTRYSYRSNPIAAQKCIEANHALGLRYLGEWHTHAEASPKASGADRDTMRSLYRRSSLNVSALLLLIRGTDALPGGASLYICVSGELKQLDILSESA
jgi:integrative and conjugative element protein (TIGR02256 family)